VTRDGKHGPVATRLTKLRDHAMHFVYFKMAARCSAVRNARIGDI
jgi:hypothetical protein